MIGGDKVSVTDSARWNRRGERGRREVAIAARLSEVRLTGLKVADCTLNRAHTRTCLKTQVHTQASPEPTQGGDCTERLSPSQMN